MIAYLDSSALVKRYIREVGSGEVISLVAKADVVGTGLISRAEVAAALAKAVRIHVLSKRKADAALKAFRARWPDLVRIQITELLMAKADVLACDLGLRGYDAVHLAGAIAMEEALGEKVLLATFDRQLWEAGSRSGLEVWPEKPDRFM